MKTYIRLEDVIAMTKLSKQSIYRLMREKQFPQNVKITRRTVVWIKEEIEEWLVNKEQARYN